MVSGVIAGHAYRKQLLPGAAQTPSSRPGYRGAVMWLSWSVGPYRRSSYRRSLFPSSRKYVGRSVYPSASRAETPEQENGAATAVKPLSPGTEPL